MRTPRATRSVCIETDGCIYNHAQGELLGELLELGFALAGATVFLQHTRHRIEVGRSEGRLIKKRTASETEGVGRRQGQGSG